MHTNVLSCRPSRACGAGRLFYSPPAPVAVITATLVGPSSCPANPARAERGVFAIAQLVGQVPMDVAFEHRCRHESIRLFLSLIESAGKTLGHGSHAAQDGHFDLDERRTLEPMLLGLIQATAELLTAIRQ